MTLAVGGGLGEFLHALVKPDQRDRVSSRGGVGRAVGDGTCNGGRKSSRAAKANMAQSAATISLILIFQERAAWSSN